MAAKKKTNVKRNPLTKAQNRLLKESLKKLLGNGLIQGQELKESDTRQLMLRDALNAIILD